MRSRVSACARARTGEPQSATSMSRSSCGAETRKEANMTAAAAAAASTTAATTTAAAAAATTIKRESGDKGRNVRRGNEGASARADKARVQTTPTLARARASSQSSRSVAHAYRSRRPPECRLARPFCVCCSLRSRLAARSALVRLAARRLAFPIVCFILGCVVTHL